MWVWVWGCGCVGVGCASCVCGCVGVCGDGWVVGEGGGGTFCRRPVSLQLRVARCTFLCSVARCTFLCSCAWPGAHAAARGHMQLRVAQVHIHSIHSKWPRCTFTAYTKPTFSLAHIFLNASLSMYVHMRTIHRRTPPSLFIPHLPQCLSEYVRAHAYHTRTNTTVF